MLLNDPLLQTLLEQDKILSKTKLGHASSTDNNQEKCRDIHSGHASETHDNCSKASVDKGKLHEDVGSISSWSNKEGGAASLLTNIHPIDQEEIIQNRLSLEQIKENPKFVNYQPGEPNKVGVLLFRSPEIILSYESPLIVRKWQL